MQFAVIAATDASWGLGRAGLIPWRFAEDFKWFKGVTAGSTCFMGRKTYEEIATMMQGKKELLPGRTCVVISSSKIDDPRVTVLNTIHDYRKVASEVNFFIGGRSIYEFGLQVADKVYITNIPGDFACDVQFPAAVLHSNFEVNDFIGLSDALAVSVFGRK